ncbi:MAG: helix-turn-helix domain-containing protein [Chloroflexota bacterium]
MKLEAPGEALVTSTVGARLRIIRRERGLSQKELAEQAGVSLNCISLIERDEILPNVATLQRLASALDVKVTAFFDADEQVDVIHLDAPNLPLATSSKVELQGICTSLGEQAMQPFMLTLRPHAYAGGYAAKTGHGFVYCLKGRLKCEIDHESYVLDPGEALLFDGPLPHRCENPGDAEAQFVLVVQPEEAAQVPMAV